MFTQSNVKLGIAPIGWTNDDLPELGGDIPFEHCIDEMAAAGYEGCEVGNKFPRDINILSQALESRNLQVASAWLSAFCTEHSKRQETIDSFIRHMHFLKEMNANVIVVCECGHCIQGKDISILGNQKPILTEEQWNALIDGLHNIGRIANESGMTVVYHHHMGTCIQTEDEIDKLMEKTDPKLVSLLFDTGHIEFAGGSALELVKKHSDRIKHVHLKDLRSEILSKVKEENLSFLEAVKAGVFTVPSDGYIDFSPIFEALKQADYRDGWFIVEAEQDPAKANPFEYAKKARQFIKESTGL